MATLGHNFIPLVDNRTRGCHDDQQLLCRTEVAPAAAALVRDCRRRGFPGQRVLLPCILQLPNELRQLRIFLILLVPECFRVVVVSLLEWSLAHADIYIYTPSAIKKPFVTKFLIISVIFNIILQDLEHFISY